MNYNRLVRSFEELVAFAATWKVYQIVIEVGRNFPLKFLWKLNFNFTIISLSLHDLFPYSGCTAKQVTKKDVKGGIFN